MDSITSDATEGRFTGSPGYRKAAEYAVSIFRKARLKPGWTDEKGEKSYLQPAPFIRNNYGTATSITILKNGKNKTFDHSAGNFVILSSGIQYENVPMASPVFIGYGINERELGWDDYAGLDVKGKGVIGLNGLPPADSVKPLFSDNLRKQYAAFNIKYRL